jgi:3-methyl-2-oxobutanoate hydroxymethyltransferase
MGTGALYGLTAARAEFSLVSFYTVGMSTTIEPTAEDRVTVRTLRRWASRGEAFACLAAYDATTARLLDRAGVAVLLAGDSAAQVVLGFERTIDMPFEFAVEMTAALRRGARRAMVMADMPFLSYTASERDAIVNAGIFMTRGMADVVKIEVTARQAGLVAAMTAAGIPVCAHVGLRPQSVGLDGSYRAAGRTVESALAVIDDAVAAADAGAVIILIEAVPSVVAEKIIERVAVPVIGIGAGSACHGQILVVDDLIGLSDAPPRFAEPVETIGPRIQAAGAAWVKAVSERAIGGRGYAMTEGEAERFEALLARGQ